MPDPVSRQQLAPAHQVPPRARARIFFALLPFTLVCCCFRSALSSEIPTAARRSALCIRVLLSVSLKPSACLARFKVECWHTLIAYSLYTIRRSKVTPTYNFDVHLYTSSASGCDAGQVQQRGIIEPLQESARGLVGLGKKVIAGCINSLARGLTKQQFWRCPLVHYLSLLQSSRPDLIGTELRESVQGRVVHILLVDGVYLLNLSIENSSTPCKSRT